MSKFKVDAQCRSCGGTGLYKGMGEAKGCAVICITCDGSGCEVIELDYEPFDTQIIRKDIERVFKTGCGYGHTPNDNVRKSDGKLIEFSKGGCTYKEFLLGVEPKPIKELYCPLLFMHQDLSKHPELKKHCISGCGEYIPKCKADRKECWEMWEKNNKK